MTDNYAPKVFTRENPCSKTDLWNCFYQSKQFVSRLVIEARTEIGINSPKYLLREGYMDAQQIEGADCYTLTPEGEAWLLQGVLRHLELHAEAVFDCNEVPQGFIIKSDKAPARILAPTAKVVQAPQKLVQPRPKVPTTHSKAAPKVAVKALPTPPKIVRRSRPA